jgi:hypothetical protein
MSREVEKLREIINEDLRSALERRESAIQRVRELAEWHKSHRHDANCDRGCAYAGFFGNQILKALDGESK